MNKDPRTQAMIGAAIEVHRRHHNGMNSIWFTISLGSRIFEMSSKSRIACPIATLNLHATIELHPLFVGDAQCPDPTLTG